MMTTFNIFNHLIWSMMNFNLKTYRTQDLVIQKSFQQPPFAQRSHCRFFSFAQWPPWQVPAPRSKEPPQPLEPRAPARVPTNGKIFCFWRRSTESCWLDLVGGFILDYLTIFDHIWPFGFIFLEMGWWSLLTPWTLPNFTIDLDVLFQLRTECYRFSMQQMGGFLMTSPLRMLW